MFLSRTEFDLEYPKYYKLEESRMSPSFILFKIFFEKNGRVVSVIRSCALVGVSSYFTYLFWTHIYEIMKVLIPILIVFSGLSFVISYLYRSKIANSSILHSIKEARNPSSSMLFFRSLLLFATDVNEFCPVLESGEFAGLIKILTLPFNGSYWKNIIKKLYTSSASFIERVRMKFRNRILKMLALCTCYILAPFISALSASIIFLILTVIAITYPTSHMVIMFCASVVFEYNFDDSRCPRFLKFLLLFYLGLITMFLISTIIVMTYAIQSFLLGLFLNLIYFIPYLAFFSVLTFYCGNYWKTMEEKYLVLKRLIYEACQDIQCVNDDCIPNRHPKREKKVLPVVSKELYDNIREKLLPYDTNLFYFGLKIFWAFAFSFGILKMIEMLNEFNVTGLVQVITTASLGVMPHIFNMIALKTSEEKKKVREEKLKLNVKYMVEDFVHEDPELARTVLIIERSCHSPRYATTEENFQPENIQYVSSV